MGTSQPKRCLDCGYILDHLPEPRCPECGRTFDPEDPRTFRSNADCEPRIIPWVMGSALSAAVCLLLLVLPPQTATTFRIWAAVGVGALMLGFAVLVRSFFGLFSSVSEWRGRWLVAFIFALVQLTGCGVATIVFASMMLSGI